MRTETSVAALVMFLVLSASTSAQSLAGWVLWERVSEGTMTQLRDISLEVQWEPKHAFERLGECRAAALASAVCDEWMPANVPGFR